MVVGTLYIFLHPCGIWKPHRWTFNIGLIREIYGFKLDHNAPVVTKKKKKKLLRETWCRSWSQYSKQRNFAPVVRTLTSRQGQESLRAWIQSLFFKPLQQIRWVALEEYQANLEFLSPKWLDSFMTSANTRSCWIVPHATKMLQKIWPIQLKLEGFSRGILFVEGTLKVILYFLKPSQKVSTFIYL